MLTGLNMDINIYVDWIEYGLNIYVNWIEYGHKHLC